MNAATEAATQAAQEAIDGAGAEPAAFSLELSDDQRDIRDWVHGFAEEVVRPAAAEWDEREETPWPVIQEAAKIGLYGFESLAQFWADPTGIHAADRERGAVLGRRRHRHVDHGHHAGGRGDLQPPARPSSWASGCRSATARPTSPQVGSFCVSEPDAGSDVSSLRTRAKYDEAKDEWVLNGQKAWATNGGIANVHVVVASVDPELGSRGPGGVRDPAAAPRASSRAPRSRSTASAPRTPPTCSSTTAACPGSCLLGGKEKLDERLARAREGTQLQEPGGDADVRGQPPDGRAPRRSASRAPPTSTRSTTPRSASSSAARSSRTRRSRSRSPT